MSDQVVVYRLNSRLLPEGQTAPPDARQVVYYSLGIGHHVGVIDTFKPILTCPYDSYAAAVAALPGGEARRKLDGVRRFGEITIDASHSGRLRDALRAARPHFDADMNQWCDRLDRALQAIDREPALTLIVRRSHEPGDIDRRQQHDG